MEKKRIALSKDVEIKLFPSNHRLMYVLEKLQRGIHYGYYINETAYEIIKLLNGQYTYNELIQKLCDQYMDTPPNVQIKVDTFIEMLINKYGIETVEIEDRSDINRVHIQNVEYEYPVVASLELTNNCNIKCRHCYGEYGDNKIEEMPAELCCKLLDELKELGVKIIEFTGGDISVYKDFDVVLEKALELNFSHIAILTNGIAISDRVFKIITNNKGRIVIQIDLHSLNDSYYNWFTQTDGYLEKVKTNIVKLARNGVRVKVVTIVTPGNIDELPYIADWVKAHGVDMLGVSAVLDMGRCKVEDRETLLFINEKNLRKYVEALAVVNKRYPGLIHEVDKPAERNNCGAITSNFVIASDGSIKICAMDNLRYCNSSIGNVFTNQVKDIFDNNSEYINAFRELKAPNVVSDECKDCEFNFFCGNCILRGIVKGLEKVDECKWLKTQVPQIIKEKLFGVIE